MRKGYERCIAVFLCLSMILLSCQPIYAADKKEDSKYSKVVAFGDSYSDNGMALKISTKIVNGKKKIKDAYIKPSIELYWNGRYSNGNTAVEVFAKKLKVSLKNYAVGGATTGTSNYSAWMDTLGRTGVLGQIEQFEKDLKGKKADSKALYFIFASANDYFYYVDYNRPGKVETAAKKAVNNLKTAVKRLTKLGAKNFFIVNSSDLAMVPYEIQMKRTKKAKAFTDYVNKNLPKELEQLKKSSKAAITLFDLPKVSREVQKNPSKYGIKVFKTPCEVTYPKAEKAKKNPDSYYFWDEWHYTKAIHSLVGKKMYEFIKK